MNNFIENYNATTKSNISSMIEKKGGMDFLSWSHAWKLCKTSYPEARYEIIRHDGKLYYSDDSGYFVTVRLFLTRQDWKEGFYYEWDHAILDLKNKSVQNKIDSQSINKAHQRCLVKVIAIATGIGLSLWTGEDLPSEEEKNVKPNWLESPEKALDRIIKMEEPQPLRDWIKGPAHKFYMKSAEYSEYQTAYKAKEQYFIRMKKCKQQTEAAMSSDELEAVIDEFSDLYANNKSVERAINAKLKTIHEMEEMDKDFKSKAS